MATSASSVGRVHDGTSWIDVKEATVASMRGGGGTSQRPVPPVLNGNGKIHVAIASFRGP